MRGRRPGPALGCSHTGAGAVRNSERMPPAPPPSPKQPPPKTFPSSAAQPVFSALTARAVGQ